MYETMALVGLAFGVKHAIEPDHVLAVSNLLEERQGKPWQLGAAWGLGHSSSLIAVGAGLILAKVAMPDRVAASFETGAAITMVYLGVSAIRTRGVVVLPHGPEHHHHHHGVPHTHRVKRSVFLGTLHGLAGSGAAAVLAAGAAPDSVSGLLYLTAFGIGTMIGMAAVTAVLGGIVLKAVNGPRARAFVANLGGLLSIGLGLYIILELWR